MTKAATLIPEFDNEMANTRRALERVPEEQLGWQPHARSMTLGGLMTHLTRLPTWVGMTFNQDEVDLASFDDESRKALDSKSAALAGFDSAVADARAVLSAVPDSAMMEEWTLRQGDQVFFAMPRIAVYRSFIMNHIIHHRGQLTVFLRLVEVPVPGMYGPSADEK